MHLTGIGGARAMRDISAAVGTLATSSASDTGSAQAASVKNATGNKADSAHFSSASQFLGNLQQLQSADPSTFAEVCQNIADQLEAAAEHRGGGHMASVLSDMAAKFQALTEGGPVSELSPEQPDTSNVSSVVVQQYVQNDQPLVDVSPEISSGHHLDGGSQVGSNGIGRLFTSIFQMVEDAVAALPTVAPPPETPVEPPVEPPVDELPPAELPPAETPVDPPAADAPPVELPPVETPVDPPLAEVPPATVPTPTDTVPVEV